MSGEEPDIFSIAIDADDYAEAAAGDVPSAGRTYQSTEDFEKVRATYVAKHDDGHLYEELLEQVPQLKATHVNANGDGADKLDQVKLDKRQQLLLGYAVGELYYDRQYTTILGLLRRVEAVCHTEGKLLISIRRWKHRCEEKSR